MNNETDVNSDLLPVNRSATTHGSHQAGASTNGPATRARPAAPSGGPGHANFLHYLPFDPWRLVEALRLRWHWLAVGGSGLGLLGLVFGLATTSASYTTTVQFIRNEGQNAFQTSEFGDAFRPRPLQELAAAKKQLKALSGDVQHTEPTGSMLREALRSAETNLIELRARYTDLYPDVQIQSNKIAAIKKQLRESGIDSSQETKTEGDV